MLLAPIVLAVSAVPLPGPDLSLHRGGRHRPGEGPGHEGGGSCAQADVAHPVLSPGALGSTGFAGAAACLEV